MKTNIIVMGAAGRMGKSIISSVIATNNATLFGAVERPEHPLIGKDAGENAGLGFLNCPISDSLNKLDAKNCIVIDFSEPIATLANLNIANKLGAKTVIGTTGFNAEQKKEIEKLSQKSAVILAPNMGIGMNVLFKAIKDISKILGDDYDVEIVEMHHHFKKDAPSGSAKGLAEAAASGLSRNLTDCAVYGREGIVGERKKEEIGIHAVRAGDIIGDHIVIFGGTGERLELRHIVQSRDTFAKGAVRAALWLYQKQSGLYDMQDVLGLR